MKTRATHPMASVGRAWRRFRACSAAGPTALVCCLALVSAGCGNGSTDNENVDGGAEPAVVLATTGIWADIAANVACDGLARVETIIPVGGDPHGFEPSLADRERMQGAVLVITNGLGLEERLEDTIDAVEAAGTPVLRIGEHVETIEPVVSDSGSDHDHSDSEGHGHESEGHGHAGGDPHVWFDPIRVSDSLDELARRLIGEAGLDPAAVAACLSAYRAELVALDAEIAASVAGIEISARKLVTNHDALGYFADRYGFEVIGSVIPGGTALDETNPAAMGHLAELIEEAGVSAIFTDNEQSSVSAEALAARVGAVSVHTLYTGSLGPPGSGADTYLGFMRTNARVIVDALG